MFGYEVLIFNNKNELLLFFGMVFVIFFCIKTINYESNCIIIFIGFCLCFV